MLTVGIRKANSSIVILIKAYLPSNTQIFLSDYFKASLFSVWQKATSLQVVSVKSHTNRFEI